MTWKQVPHGSAGGVPNVEPSAEWFQSLIPLQQ